MKKRIVVILLTVFFGIGSITAAGQFDPAGISADLTGSVVSAKTQIPPAKNSSKTAADQSKTAADRSKTAADRSKKSATATAKESKGQATATAWKSVEHATVKGSDDPEPGSVADILQEANRVKYEQRLPIATSQDDDENSWTLAIYMCGSDLERDKAAGTRDLCEMLGAQTKMAKEGKDLDNLNLIVMTGGAGNDLWRPESVETPDVDGFVKPQGTQIWQISGGQMHMLYQFDEYQDMSDGTLAKTFFRFAAEYAPAEHMMIEYWDHGGGPIKGAEFALNSDGSDNRYMPLNDLSEAVSDVKEYRSENGKNLEIIGFDCCLMSSLEVAYAFRDKADFMIASEETEPIDGWDYYWLEIFAEMKEINTPPRRAE